MPWYVIAVLAVLAVLIAGVVIERCIVYIRESKYIKMEIARSVSHHERAHWERRLKRLRREVLFFKKSK